MALQWQKFRHIIFSVFDQAWLSALSLLVAFVFIRNLDKSDYALYILLTNSVLFFQGIGGALLTSPYTTVRPQQPEYLQNLTEVIFCQLTLLYGLVAGTVAFFGYAVYCLIDGQSTDGQTCLALAACVIGAIFRDNIRAFFYARRSPDAALRNNVLYGLLLIAGIGLLFSYNALSTSAVLYVLGFVGILVSTGLLRISLEQHQAVPRQAEEAAQLKSELWKCGQWAIVGSLTTFITLYSYPYFTALVLDQTSVADISAARLLSVPLTLLGTAWSNMMRPTLSRWYAQDRHEDIENTVWRATWLFAVGSLLVGGLLYNSGNLLTLVLGNKYAHLQSLAMWWSLYAGTACIKGVHAATLMMNGQGYRALSRISIVTMFAMIVLMAMAGYTKAPESIVAALMVAEIIQIILIRHEHSTKEYQKCQTST